MDFCSKVSIKLLLKAIETEGKKKNILTSPLSYNAIMNIVAAGSSNDTRVQILRFLQRKNIEEVNSDSKKFLELTSSEQTRKAGKRKIEDAGIENTARKDNKDHIHNPLVGSDKPFDQFLRSIERKNIKEVNPENSMFANDISRQTRQASKPKIDEAGIENTARKSDHSHDPLVRSDKPFDQFYPFSFQNAFNPAFPHFGDNGMTNGEDDGEGPIISFLNGVWVNKNFCLKDCFQELLENLYKAKVRNIDCQKPEIVVKEANEWANASTKGLIKEVLNINHINQDTTLIMGNALYFKGSWKDTFIKNRTVDKPFFLLDSKTIKVPFMTGCKKYSHKFFDDFQVARIPYSNGGDINREFAMYIFLPYEKDGIQSLLRNVDSNPEFFNQHCDFPKGGKVDIFYIPKFKFSYITEEAPNIMTGMGLSLPFDKEMAEFHEMIEGDQNISVSNIVQKAFIEVNEEGTEAAAVTFMTTSCGCAMGPPRKLTEFIADHPFMFTIREENSGIVFFAGTLLNPMED